jgi:hypothetical protein
MQWDAETLQTEFISQTKFFEAEEIFVDIGGKVTASELITAVIERTDTVCTNTVAQSGPLQRLASLPGQI